MIPRLAVLALTFCVAFGAPAFAKDTTKKKPVAAKPAPKAKPTLREIADYVLKNGVDQTIHQPISRDLGFATDEVATKALRHKASVSPDKRVHAFYVLYTTNKSGVLSPHEIILSNSLTVSKDGEKTVDGLNIRTDLDGKLLAAVRSQGIPGDMKQRVLATDSSEAISGYSDEKSLFIERMDYSKLSK